VDPATIAPGALATALAAAVKNVRPELDLYLLTDRAIEQIATTDEVAPIRRMFHNIEELMELHSHHYGFVLSGVQPYDVEAFPLTQYSMYGAVPLRTIKKALLDCKAEGTLDRVRAVDLTNCTFAGHMYNTARRPR
jgi:hypothetical protein